jgi:hypothetical protein
LPAYLIIALFREITGFDVGMGIGSSLARFIINQTELANENDGLQETYHAIGICLGIPYLKTNRTLVNDVTSFTLIPLMHNAGILGKLYRLKILFQDAAKLIGLKYVQK